MSGTARTGGERVPVPASGREPQARGGGCPGRAERGPTGGRRGGGPGRRGQGRGPGVVGGRAAEAVRT
ncbi:hypothetical protein E4099_10130 [Streptomyces palmae]|uniref:Uncharacterized protein n=1 Tax=Streptomyces palmae TaxID=1701085 RepID=A0A4Z0HEQ3_9ACTN|nr:hypothetical protein E4099_10130 [Streptomyces palmae]